MATLADAKTIAAGFNEEEKWVTVTYNFANDTGAVADYTVLTTNDDIVITGFYANVTTALTSATDFDIDLGVGAGGTEFWSDKAKAGFAINTVVSMDTAANVRVPADGTVVMGIETAAATAGVMELNFRYKTL